MIEKIIGKSKNMILSQTARQSYITTFGAGLNAIFGFLFTILVARGLTPSDFGIVSVLSSMVVVVLSISDLGFSSALMRFIPKTEKENDRLAVIKVVLVSATFICLIISILFLLANKFISLAVFNNGNYSGYIVFLTPVILGLTIWSISSNLLYAQKKIVQAVAVDISATFIKFIAVFILFIIGSLSLVNVVLSMSLTPYLTVILASLFIPLGFIKIEFNKNLLKEIFSFGFYIFLSNIIVSLLGQIDNFILVKMLNTTETGIFAAANRFTFIFPVLIRGFTAVLMPKFSGFKLKEEARIFLKKVNLSILFFLIPIVILYLLSDKLTFWIYGASYMNAAPVFRLLLIKSVFFLLSVGPLTTLVYFFGDSKVFTLISALQLLLLVVLDIVFISATGVYGPAFAGIISYGIIFVLANILVFKRFNQGKR